MSARFHHIARTILLTVMLLVATSAVLAWILPSNQSDHQANASPPRGIPLAEVDRLPTTDIGWKERLTHEEYFVLRKGGTEPAYTGDLWDHKAAGTYHCAGCGQALFSSETKYRSGTGWPSYYAPINQGVIGTKLDRHWLFGDRTEVHCSRCKGHLGHVFNDGPRPTGLRYCLNSAALDFKPAKP